MNLVRVNWLMEGKKELAEEGRIYRKGDLSGRVVAPKIQSQLTSEGIRARGKRKGKQSH